MSNHRSFTLIELLVVIAIIGVLAAIVITSISGAITKSKIVRLQVFSDSIRAQLSDSLVSYWSFNEGTGTTTYDQWEGNNGTLGGDPEWKSGGECVSGKCLEFDGDGDYVNCGNNASLWMRTNNYTVAFWFKLNRDANSAYEMYIRTGAGGSGLNRDGYYISQYNNSLLQISFSDGVIDRTFSYISLPSSPYDHNWHHIVIVFNRSSNIIGYYDGNQSNSAIDISARQGDVINENTLNIGGWGSSNSLSGLIDEVRIYNSAVSITQIQSQYLAGLDKLLSNGAISKSEYNQRIKELSKEIVIE